MKRKKLLSRQHTGKLVHRHNTAYGLLIVVLLFAILPLFVLSSSVGASADPVTTSDSVFAVVSAPIPTTAAEIKNITNGQVFTTAELVPIRGTCPKDTVVKIFKNQVMAGSALCVNGTFNLSIDLFIGANSIIARAYNINNVPGPDSAPITVTLTLATSSSGGNATGINPGNQLFLTSDTYFQGVHTKEKLTWPIIVSGGQAPYAISVGWGDGKTDLISRSQAGPFTIEHVYEKPGDGYKGSYQITVLASDQSGTKSFLQLAVIVNDTTPSALASARNGYNSSGLIRIAWQLFIGCLLAIIIFWLGEQYEIRILKRKHILA